MQKMTRKRALGLAGSAGVSIFAARRSLPRALDGLATESAAAATTALTPTMTEGPYWIDELLRRFDVRAGQDGVPLSLRINVHDADNGNGAVNGAHVDIWHANAYGLYSDESAAGTKGQTFLRGYQVTGVDPGLGASAVDGQVSFKTVWPGWYAGRAIHIHVRVRTYDTGGNVATNYTTQIFFTDAANNVVLSGAAPYNTRTPAADPTTDETDNVLTSAARSTNVVTVSGSIASGYDATFDIYLSGLRDVGAAADSSDVSVSASLAAAVATRAANGRSLRPADRTRRRAAHGDGEGAARHEGARPRDRPPHRRDTQLEGHTRRRRPRRRGDGRADARRRRRQREDGDEDRARAGRLGVRLFRAGRMMQVVRQRWRFTA